MELRIVGMNIRDYECRDGNVAATFSAAIGPVRLDHCLLLRKPEGGFEVRTPRGKYIACPVFFTDQGLYSEFRRRAVEMYELMTGKELPADAVEDDAAGLRRAIRADIEEMVG